MTIFKLLNILLVASVISLTACNKALEVTPKYILNTDKAFLNDSMAGLQMAGLYAEFANSSELSSGMHLDMALLSDEMEPLSYNAVAGASGYSLYHYVLRPIDAPTNTYWTNLYKFIYYCNAAIAGVDASGGMSPAFKKQCKGEALAWRAFFYYYLSGLYGALPYVTNGNYKETQHYGRTSVDSILNFCIRDLSAADTLVSENYPAEGRFRFNRAAVNAVLSRVALAKGDYQMTITAAGRVLNDNRYSLETLDNMFSADSKETILQLWNQYGYTNVGQMANSEYATIDATHGTDLSLYESFDQNDLRRDRFMRTQDDGSGNLLYLNNKYRNNGVDLNTGQSEYLILCKLDEVLLNRAEAYARMQNSTGAISDVNRLRKRAGLDPLSESLNAQAIADSIIAERRKELCFEWADRWLSLKRNNNASQVMAAFKPDDWSNKALLLPIPLTEIQSSSLTQNKDY